MGAACCSTPSRPAAPACLPARALCLAPLLPPSRPRRSTRRALPRLPACPSLALLPGAALPLSTPQVDALRAVRSFSPGLGMGNLLKLVEAQELALTCDEVSLLVA